MPLATTNITEIVNVQTYLGETCLNRYFYQQTSVATPFFLALFNDFYTKVILPLANAQTTAVTHTEVVIRVVNNLAVPEARFVLSQAGQVVDNPMPSLTAVNFKLNRSTKETRNGSKRYCGLGEAQVTDNSLNAGGITTWATMEAPLATALTDGVDTFNPCMFRPDYPVVGQDTYNLVSSATLSSVITSQRSRKP